MEKRTKAPPDFMDWEKIRSSDAYKREFLNQLRVAIADKMLPGKELSAMSEDDRDDTIAEIFDKLNRLTTPEDFQKFASDNSISLDLDKIGKTTDKAYQRSQKELSLKDLGGFKN